MKLYYNNLLKHNRQDSPGLQWISADHRYVALLPQKRVQSKTPEFIVFDALNTSKLVTIGTCYSIKDAERLIDEDVIKREEDRLASKAW